MFSFLGEPCPRCSGALAEEWKIDLPGCIEKACINCGFRYWEKSKRQRKFHRKAVVRKKKVHTVRSSPVSPRCVPIPDNSGKTKKENPNNKKGQSWRRGAVSKEARDCFNDETGRQILKRQSPRQKKWKSRKKTNTKLMAPVWMET